MGLLFRFLEDFRRWDRPSQIALLLALFLFVIFLLAGFTLANHSARIAAIVGAAGALIAAQVIVFWGNRHLITDFARAQKLYLAGEYAAARDLLLKLEQGRKDQQSPDVRLLALLGHTLRNLGDLEASEATLRRALRHEPSSHFPLYALGRTLICKGEYAEAAHFLQQAIDAGAASIAQFDLGHALYRAGQSERAKSVLSADVPDDAHRNVMRQYLLFRLGAAPLPAPDQVRAALPLWQQELHQAGDTPYAVALAEDLITLKALAGEER